MAINSICFMCILFPKRYPLSKRVPARFENGYPGREVSTRCQPSLLFIVAVWLFDHSQKTKFASSKNVHFASKFVFVRISDFYMRLKKKCLATVLPKPYISYGSCRLRSSSTAPIDTIQTLRCSGVSSAGKISRLVRPKDWLII